jgi:osmoprotectant transport system permease protein
VTLGAGPVIPKFGTGSSCVQDTSRLFCPDWVRDHWHDTLEPALVQHLKLTAIAIVIGFAIAFAAALVVRRAGWLETPANIFATFVYTIPSLALFQLLVPITDLSVTTVEIALIGYTLLILFQNTVAGLRSAPAEVLEAARGMGLTRRQTLARVELPLALPAIIAGLRIATVTTISIATVAAFIIPQGLGRPILYALSINFQTEVIAAGVLAIALALGADIVLVLAQRALTPWARARRAT